MSKECASLSPRSSSFSRPLLRNVRPKGSALGRLLGLVPIVSNRFDGLLSSKLSRVTCGGRRLAMNRSGVHVCPRRGEGNKPPRSAHWLDLNGELAEREDRQQGVGNGESDSPELEYIEPDFVGLLATRPLVSRLQVK